MSIRPGGPSKADLSGTYSSIAATGRTVGPYRGYIGGLFPPGVKMKMANFTPFTPADWTAHANQAVGYQWAAWDWAGWIKPQIDLAAANGFNCFRIAGTMGGLARGQLTMAQYLAQWQQVLDYTASKGLWLYPGGESFNDYGGCTQAFATDVLVQMATLFNSNSHVFAFDLVNEAMGSGINNGLDTGAKVGTYCQALYTAVKAVTKIPLTVSAPFVGATTSALWSDSARRALLNFVDFWDFHLYYDAAPADMVPFLTDAATYKPFLVGECGQTSAAGAAARTSRMAALRSIAEHPDCMGAGVWAITDQDTAAGNQWGIWPVLGGAPRAEYLAGAQSLPSTGRPLRVVLSDVADLTLDGGTGAFKTTAAYSTTQAFVKPVRARIRLVMDASVATAGVAVTSRLKVDGAVLDPASGANGRAAVFYGNSNTGEGTVYQEWQAFLTPGSHTFAIDFGKFGAAVNSKILFANTQVILDFEPA